MTAVGIVFLLTADTLTSANLVFCGGILFIIAGIANTLISGAGRNKGAFSSVLSWMVTVAAAILGLCMLLFNSTFIGLISFMLATLVLFTAIFQLCLLIHANRTLHLHPTFFIIPILLFGAAVYIYMQRPDGDAGGSITMLATGGAFALFGLATLTETIVIAHAKKAAEKTAGDEDDTIDESIEAD